MARTIRTAIRFVELPSGDPRSVLQAVEVRRGARATTVGRVAASRDEHGRAHGWHALRVAGYVWTPFRATRAAAVADMLGLVDVARERGYTWGAYTLPACAAAGVTLLASVEAALDGVGARPAVAQDEPCACPVCVWETSPVGSVPTPLGV
jgi:hypothetical protein